MTTPLLEPGHFCYYVPEDQEPDPKLGYMPSVVIEGDAGHYPCLGGSPFAAPRYWGDLDQARDIASEQNAAMELTQEDVRRIMETSIFARPA